LTTNIQTQIPNRSMYVFYNTGAEENRMSYGGGQGYLQWGWDAKNMVSNTDQPSFEDYYGGLASWTNNSAYNQGNPALNDLLTKVLDAKGYNIALGHPLDYSWVSGGWSVTDTNALSDIPTYTGFLKCLYTAGMVGGVAGYFSYPSGTNGPILGGPGFDAAFPSNSPPNWLLQMMALAHVHALFSHLERFLYSGSLLSGPQVHVMSTDQPAYEFTNSIADPYSRVLARQLNGLNKWIVTAWNSNETTNTVTVNIPTIGNLTVTATPSANVYQVAVSGTNVQRTLLDEYAFPQVPSNLRVSPN